jgi:5'-3' exonuclease
VPAPLLVVDAPFLLYRSFFALPESIRGADDRPVGALLGAANALLRVVADRRPRAVVVCFGAEAAAYRVELFEPYHADRPPVPDPLAWQFEQAPALFSAFGWGCQGSEDLEADDLLGSYAAAETAAGGSTLILTGDRDMYQCVGEQVAVLYLKSGTSGFETIDAAEVRRRYGIEPALVPDFIALRGDPSDSLPGAPGVGPKTAAELLERYGSLEGALAAVGTVERPRPAPDERPRVAQSLRENAGQLRRYREIARLRLVDLERPADAETNLDAGAAAARMLGLNALANRLDAADSLGEL